jgi:DNA-binding MarR family transcriptional regulator
MPRMTTAAHRSTGDTELDSLDVARLFGLASKAVGTQYWRISHEAGLGASAMGLMVALDRSVDGMSVRDAAKACWITPASLSGIADRLERDGLLSRRRSTSDRRVVTLHITEAGRDQVRHARQVLDELFSTAFDFVDPADEPTIRRFLLQVIDRFAPIRADESQGYDE